MDGNGRWASKKGLPRTMGHNEGVKKAKEVILLIKELGIPVVSLYTFSKENWKRSEEEV
jgi:undecaprenyl diphosphate synthase